MNFARATIEFMSDALSEELQRYVDRQVASGRYPSESAVLEEALRLLQLRDAREARLGSAAELVSRGIDLARTRIARENPTASDEELDHLLQKHMEDRNPMMGRNPKYFRPSSADRVRRIRGE